MRIIISGSWSFRNYALFVKKMDELTFKVRGITVLTTHQKGVEQIAEWWAHRNWWSREVYRPNFTKYGKTKEALQLNNEDMIRNADALIVFKVKANPHIKDLIKRAKRHDLKVKVIEVGFSGTIPRSCSQLPHRPLGST